MVTTIRRIQDENDGPIILLVVVDPSFVSGLETPDSAGLTDSVMFCDR